MPVLAVVNIHHAYGSHAILDGATVSIDHGEKVGLVGRNGSGKTTLMKVMQGTLVPDGGQVQIARGARVGYLSQDPDLDPHDTLRDAAEAAFDELHRLHVEQHKLFEAMAHTQGEDLERLMKRHTKLESQIEAAGGYAIDHKIDAMLHGLGFTDDQFSLKVSNLSGGQKGRLGLARLLLEEPDLLLLDEPTNHLDIAGRQWLEAFLAGDYRGAVVVVSHDRWLLDKVVSRIIEVDRGVIRESPGNYHKYVELRQERLLTQARVYDKQMDRIRQEQQYIDRYRAGQRARQAKGREARLERFKRNEVVERPMELEVMNLQLPKAPRSGDQVVVAEGISKSYGDKVLFKDLNITISRGERIGIIGPNGAGKTTLVRCLLGELKVDGGTIRTGSRLSIGYYKQLHDHLDMSLTVWQYLQSVIVGLGGSGAKGSEQQARDLAGAFLFSGDEQEKVLGQLSGGERSRAVLAGLVSGAHNVLVLDEPTNHLDIPSAERLEQALSMGEGGFEGTLLLITHDRQLLQDTCSRLIVLDGQGGARAFDGTYSDWERRQREEAAAAQSKPPRKPVAKPQAAARASTTTKSKPTGLAALSLDKIEARIEELQTKVRAIDQQMLDPTVFSDGVRSKSLQVERAHLEVELEPLETEWARRADGA
jgi:ATP-binding cassette subfamily F protein 3